MLTGRNYALVLNTNVKPLDDFVNFAADFVSRRLVDFRPFNFKRISFRLVALCFGAMRIRFDPLTRLVFGANLGCDLGANARFHLGALANFVCGLQPSIFLCFHSRCGFGAAQGFILSKVARGFLGLPSAFRFCVLARCLFRETLRFCGGHAVGFFFGAAASRFFGFTPCFLFSFPACVRFRAHLRFNLSAQA